MALPRLAEVCRLLVHGAAASTNERIRVDWNRFRGRLKYTTLRLCFANQPPAAPQIPTPFQISRTLIDGSINIFSIASATVLCVGVPIAIFRRLGGASASSLNPWSALSQIQEFIVDQAGKASLFRSVSLVCVACASFAVEAHYGSPRVAVTALLPSASGIVPHMHVAAARPLDRALMRIRGVCFSQLLRAVLCSCFLSPSKPSFSVLARAALSSMPLRLLGVFYLELGRFLLHQYPAISQMLTHNFHAPRVIHDGHEDEAAEDELDRTTELLHIQLARSGIVFHSNHLSFAPISLIHEHFVSSLFVNPLIFAAELRSWHTLLHACSLTVHESPGFLKRLFLGFWFRGSAVFLQNVCIASSLVFNELAAYVWGEEPHIAAVVPRR
jgi:hypothetical protein